MMPDIVGAMCETAKNFLVRLYGCRPWGSASCFLAEDRLFYAEMRVVGRRVLRRFGWPLYWVPWRVGSEEVIDADGDPELRQVVDRLLRSKVWLQVMADSEPPRRLKAGAQGPVGQGFQKIILQAVRVRDVIWALQVSREKAGGDISREPNLEVLDEVFDDGRLRAFVEDSLVASLSGGLGKFRGHRQLYDDAIYRAMTPPKPVGRRERQAMFLAALERVGAPRAERLAVKRANALFGRGYFYNVREFRRRMSWRLGGRGQDSLRRAAKRYLRFDR